MSHSILTVSALALALTMSAGVTSAGNGNSKGPKGCPPGLAKKGCVPPGQLKKYAPGDTVTNYIWVEDPPRWGLTPGQPYVIAGGYVYHIDRDTQKVLNLIGAVADILQ